MESSAKIKEMFTSIQGEGPYVGYKQLFIRFCGCNINCLYCDTDFYEDEDTVEFTAYELAEYIKKFDLPTLHSISLTGGEPLLWADFLAEFLPLLDAKIYLETNATLPFMFEKVAPYVDVISADIKLPSTSGLEQSFQLHDEFFKSARECEKFAKIVFDEDILDDEIENCVKLAQKYNLELVLQPKMYESKLAVTPEKIVEVHNKFLSKYARVRVIPQVHNFLSLQ